MKISVCNDFIKLKTFTLEKNDLSQVTLREMEDKIHLEIQNAFAFAENSPFPDPSEATTGQYKSSLKISHELSELVV